MLLVVSREQSLANPSPDKQKTTGVRRNGVTPNERYLLDRVADLDTEPSVVLVRHVGASDTVHNTYVMPGQELGKYADANA
jgi:hypothetical protein